MVAIVDDNQKRGIGYDDGVALILASLKDEPYGLSISDISRKSGLNRSSVAKYLSVLVTLGRVEMHIVGSAKVYLLSSRVSAQEIFDYIQDRMIIADAMMRIIDINQSSCEHLNLFKSDLLNKEIDVIPSSLLQEMINSTFFQQAARGKKTVTEIDGRYLVAYVPVVLRNGQHGVVIIYKDIPVSRQYHVAF